MRVGVNLYPQETSFGDLVVAAAAADTSGCDSVWIWDHLYGVVSGRQDVFESWSTLAALSGRTTRVTLGTLVASNTFRHPALLAKAAVTLDHASDGRAVLGVGAGYQEAEHEAFGLDLGGSRDERIRRLSDSLEVIERLLAGEEVTTRAGRYRLTNALLRPLPFRGAGTLPLMIGGGSEGIVRLVARHATYWHTRGSVSGLRRRLEQLERECAAAGTDFRRIQLCIGNPVVIRDDAAQAEVVYSTGLEHNGQTPESAPGELWMGSPAAVAERWLPYARLGFRHLIADVPSPHDRETLERLVEVRDLVAASL